MKEQCTIWEEAKEKGGLSPECPLHAVCNGEGCLMSVNPIEKNRRKELVYERSRHYSDVPDHKARSEANHI